MTAHSSILAWRIPWMEEPGGLRSTGSLRVGHDGTTSLSLFTCMHWRRKWQPTPVFLPGESQGREPGGRPSLGSHRVGHDWSDLAAAAAARVGHDLVTKPLPHYSNLPIPIWLDFDQVFLNHLNTWVSPGHPLSVSTHRPVSLIPVHLSRWVYRLVLNVFTFSDSKLLIW